MDASLPATSLAEILARRIATLDPARLPATVRRKCEDLAVDVVGLCLTARNEDYVKAALAGWDEEGSCTAIGHAGPMSAAGAAFVNGTAAHGEDFDDTFEGGPVHAGAVIVPAQAAVLGMGVDALILAFVVIVIGGLGSLEGALVGALIVGFVRTAGIQFFAEIELAVLYLIAAAVLLVRPTGLFGKA